jgi:hypothetical protein
MPGAAQGNGARNGRIIRTQAHGGVPQPRTRTGAATARRSWTRMRAAPTALRPPRSRRSRTPGMVASRRAARGPSSAPATTREAFLQQELHEKAFSTLSMSRDFGAVGWQWVPHEYCTPSACLITAPSSRCRAPSLDAHFQRGGSYCSYAPWILAPMHICYIQKRLSQRLAADLQ